MTLVTSRGKKRKLVVLTGLVCGVSQESEMSVWTYTKTGAQMLLCNITFMLKLILQGGSNLSVCFHVYSDPEKVLVPIPK